MIKNYYIKFLLIIIISSFNFTKAQFTIETYRKFKDLYPEENYIQILDKVIYKIDIVKNNLDIKLYSSEQYIFLKNTQNMPIMHKIYSSEFSNLIKIDACSYVLKNKKYKKIPVKKFYTKTGINSNVFYDDVKEINFSFPGIAPGTIIEVKTIHDIKEPRLLSSYFLNSYHPIYQAEFTIDCDNNIEVDILKLNMPQEPFIQSYNLNNRKIITWKGYYLKEIEKEEYEPDRRYFVPHFIPVIKRYKINDLNINVLTDINSLYNWYYNLIANYDSNSDLSKIKNLVKEITKNCNNEFEKVKKIYYWVQENIKYIAFEYGYGGFIPRPPDVIFNNKFGDCKDKSALLKTMLNLEGINAYFTWIGTNDIPYSYSTVYTPLADNHMIITYVSPDSIFYYLDATGYYQPIEIPTSFIQNKEALISINKDKFLISRIPIVSSKLNIFYDSVEFNIEGSKLKGSGTLLTGGYYKTNIINTTFDLQHKDKKDIINKILEKGNNKFQILNFDLKIKPYELNNIISYDCSIDNYITRNGKEIYVNLNLNRNFLKYKIQNNRKHPLYFDYTFTKIFNFTLKIPEGYKIKYIPENLSVNFDKFESHINYKLEENSIRYYHKIVVDTLLITKELFGTWSTLINSLEKAYRQTIVLEKE